MKKLKNIFLLGFLICLSIFLGINISFLAYTHNADFSYSSITSDVRDNGMQIEKNYFKSKYRICKRNSKANKIKRYRWNNNSRFYRYGER